VEEASRLSSQRRVTWPFGVNDQKQLGLGNSEVHLHPALVGGLELFGSSLIVMVASGVQRSASVEERRHPVDMVDGIAGKLGHRNEPRERPMKLSKELFGGSPAVMVACGSFHTVVLQRILPLSLCVSAPSLSHTHTHCLSLARALSRFSILSPVSRFPKFVTCLLVFSRSLSLSLALCMLSPFPLNFSCSDSRFLSLSPTGGDSS